MFVFLSHIFSVFITSLSLVVRLLDSFVLDFPLVDDFSVFA